MNDVQQTFTSLGRLLGNTPLLALDLKYRGEPRVMYAKAEHYNLTGSIKDRMMLHILRKAYREGHIQAGDGLSRPRAATRALRFRPSARPLGHPVTIFMPDWMSRERKDLIRSFGAEDPPGERRGGRIPGLDPAERGVGRRDPGRLPSLPVRQRGQTSRPTKPRRVPRSGPQLASEGLMPDAFVAGVGTGGTVMGVGRFLRSKVPGIRIHPMEPENSPTLRTGHKVGKHRIQGISDEFIPAIVKLDQLDEIVSVDDGDSILMAQKLARRGLAVGISSGANFLARAPGAGRPRQRRGGGDGLLRQQQEVPLHRPDEGRAREGSASRARASS